MTKQITTESGIVLLLVEVKHTWYNFDIEDNRIYFWEKIEEQEHLDFRALPEGNWQGKHFNEMSEEEYRVLSKNRFNSSLQNTEYFNHEKRYYNERLTAKGSIASLIRSHGFDPENTVVLTLKK